MIRDFISAAVLTLTIAGAMSGAAVAQEPSAAAGLGGPVVPGVCLLSREAVFANSAVGRAATARLQELTQAAQAEIDAERVPLEAEVRALSDDAAAAAELAARREAAATSWQALQRKAEHNAREIQATRAQVLERISTEAQPVIQQVYTQQGCGLLFDRGSALGGNFANDLTAGVVQSLDDRIQTTTFERERLPESPVQGQ